MWVVLTAQALGQPAENAEIVLYSYPRIAFYEPAPRAMATSMRNAVKQRCGSSRHSEWYCSGVRLRFLREVNVLGDRHRTGLACDPDTVTPDLRFYLEDMFRGEDTRCVYVAYDVRKKRHVIDEG
jgi:hypothetical protein